MIKNAIIESVSIDDGGRKLLTAWMFLDYGDSGHQGFGGHALYLPKDYKHHGGPNFAGHFIYRAMQIGGVSSWDKLKGISIRVRLSGPGFGATIEAIGHVTKEDWFDPAEDFKAMLENFQQ